MSRLRCQKDCWSGKVCCISSEIGSCQNLAIPFPAERRGSCCWRECCLLGKSYEGPLWVSRESLPEGQSMLGDLFHGRSRWTGSPGNAQALALSLADSTQWNVGGPTRDLCMERGGLQGAPRMRTGSALRAQDKSRWGKNWPIALGLVVTLASSKHWAPSVLLCLRGARSELLAFCFLPGDADCQ